MSYELQFYPSALKEWHKLDATIRNQFKKKLQERLEIPRIAKDKLSGFDDIYKIKLRDVGYRLAYQVKDEIVTVVVLAIGERNKSKIYMTLHECVNKLK